MTSALKNLLCHLFLVLVLLAAPSAARADDPGFFLLVVPESGPLAQLGKYARDGAELALKTWGAGSTLRVIDETAEFPEDLDLAAVSVVVGYFTESRFQADAPRFLYLRKPVLLPFLTSLEPASRGPMTFFRLMPTFSEQGRFLALEILQMKQRPRRILIVLGPGQEQATLAASLKMALTNPPPPKAPDPPPKGQKAPKAPAPLKPLDAKAEVITVDIDQALAPESIPELGKDDPDLIILATGLPDALRLAPTLADSKFAKVPIWGGTILGFRESGAAFSSLKLNLSLCLPVANLVSDQNKAAQEFKRRYVAAYQAQPTWVSALAYDSLNLAIKAVASGEPLDMFFTDQTHYALGTYELAPGGGGSPPLAMMPVRQETIGFLP